MGTVAPELILDEKKRRKQTTTKQTNDALLTRFYCTGFSSFHGVSENPTQLLIRGLPTSAKEKPHLPDDAVLASTTVLKVAAESVREVLDDMYAHIADCPIEATRVLLHFGVNAGSKNFKLELVARNEATFTVPDEHGWSPILQPIDPSYGGIRETRRTHLPLDALVHNLRQEYYDVDVSTDAGRFVCNWLYFHSLKRAETHNAFALFVHVPPLTIIPLDEQLRFAKSLIRCIADLPVMTPE